MPLSTLTRGQHWSPLALQPLAWFYAHPKYFTLGIDDVINQWRCRAGSGNILTGAAITAPVWNQAGWRTGVGAAEFDGLGTFFTCTSGSILSAFTGADIPFSCLLTARIDTTSNHGFLEWSDAGSARSEWRTNDTPPEVQRYSRVADDAGSVTVTGTLDVGTANSRFGLSFPGTTVTTYRARDVDSAAAACNVNTATLSLFTFGKSTVGQLDGVATELVILPRAMTAAEWERYVYYSIGEFG